jgi:two-component system NarL family sensor kinase
MVSHQLPRYKPIVPASRTNSKPCVSRADLRHSTPYHKLFKPFTERTSQLQQMNIELHTQAEVVRELSGRLLQMQDEERRRIARELHDSVGQILAALAMNLSAVQSESDRITPAAAAALVEGYDLVREISRQVRTISYLLHPPLLDEVGLISALQWYVEGFGERSKIQVSLNLPADFGRLPRDMEIAIFRIVQECLTNVHRHSGSRSAAVCITRAASQLRVEVEDAGKGVPAEKQLQIVGGGRTGVGMSGMRERVRQFGGRLEVSSVPGHTIVVATLPLSEGRASSASAN